MKKFYLFVILILSGSVSFGQGCGTAPLDSVSFDNQPWIGNNIILNQLYDSISSLTDTGQYQHKAQSSITGGFDAQTIFSLRGRR